MKKETQATGELYSWSSMVVLQLPGVSGCPLEFGQNSNGHELSPEGARFKCL